MQQSKMYLGEIPENIGAALRHGGRFSLIRTPDGGHALKKQESAAARHDIDAAAMRELSYRGGIYPEGPQSEIRHLQLAGFITLPPGTPTLTSKGRDLYKELEL